MFRHAIGTLLAIGPACSPSGDQWLDGHEAAPESEPAATDAESSTGVDAPPRQDATAGGRGQGASGSESSGGGNEPLGHGAPTFAALEVEATHGYLIGVYGPGLAWADLDGNGWLDLIAVGGTLPSTILRNDDGVLSDAMLDTEVVSLLDTAGVSTPDYDNDGDPDVYLLRRGTSRLLRNDGSFEFVDVTAAAGVGYDGAPASATWGDFDGDGRLDLYISTLGSEADVLYRSQSDGRFVDRTDLLPGMTGDQSFGASFVDFDDDGDVDLYVVNDKYAGNRLWRNDGPGCDGWCFTEVGAAWGIATRAFGMGLGVGDFDNDLDLDLSFADLDKHHLMRNDQADGQPLFAEVALALGVSYPAHGWGTVFFDADNDGWLELFVADSQGPGAQSRMFRNLEGQAFSDISAASGCVRAGWNFGVAHGDFDVDGRVDLAVGTRGVGTTVFHNLGGGDRHWLEVELHGGGPVNRDAIGARVVVETADGARLRRDVEIGSGLASQSSPRLHFGLGDAVVTAIEIRWPDGTLETPEVPVSDALWVHGYPGG